MTCGMCEDLNALVDDLRRALKVVQGERDQAVKLRDMVQGENNGLAKIITGQ